MKRIIIVLALTILLVSNGFATKQGHDLIDSLLVELSSATTDTNKIKIYSKLAFASYQIEPEKGLEYAEKGIKMANSINWDYGKASCLVHIGTNYSSLSKYQESIKSYKKALKIWKDLDNKNEIALSYANLGYVYDIKSDYDNALENYFKALEIYESLNAQNRVASTLSSIGVIYDLKSEYFKAMECYYKALKIFEDMDIKSGAAQVVGNIGVVYQILEQYDKALASYLKAYKIYEELDDDYGKAINLSNIGMVYKEEKKHEKSLDYFLRALKINEKLNIKNLIVNNITNIGNLYRITGRYEEALEYYNKSLAISQEIDDKYCTGRSYGNLGVYHLDLAKDSVRKLNPNNTIIKENSPKILLERAISYLTISISMLEEISADNEVQEFKKHLSEVYALQENYKSAYNTYKSHTIIKDSIFSIDIQRAIANLEAERKNEIYLKEIEILKQEVKSNTKFSYFLLIILGLVVIALVFRTKRKK